MKYLNKFNIFIFFILFLYVFYNSEIILSGSNRDYYFKYYLISLLGIIFSISIYIFNKTINDFLNLSMVSIIFSLYLFEYYLSKKEPLKEGLNIRIEKYKELSGKDWDQRTQYQVYRELLKTNKDVVPYFYPSVLNIGNNLKIHSLAGVSNSLTIFCNENGYYSINKSDRYGFNNPDKEWDADLIDYVFVGDSFTHGFCVNRPHDIPSVIRENYNQRVLNLGYGRNGPLKEYATLREYLPKNAKKIVFIYYEGNDLINLTSELKNNILLKYIKNENFSQKLKDKQKLIDNQKRKQIKIRSNGENFTFIKLGKTRKKISNLYKKKLNTDNKEDTMNEKDNLKKLEDILSLTKKLAFEKKIDFHFVYLPISDYYFNNKNFPDESLNFKEVSSIVKDLNINFIDIHKEILEKQMNPKKFYPFETRGHYNVDGYKKIADTIFKLTNLPN